MATGQSTSEVSTGSVEDSVAAVDGEKTFTESEVKALIERAVKARLAGASKAKQEAEELRAKVAELTAAADEKQSAGLTEKEQLERKVAKLQRDLETQVSEWKAKAESETRARQETLIRHAIQSEINKRGLKEPELIEAYLTRVLSVTTDGRVVRSSSDGDEQDVGTVFDAFIKAHPGVVPPPSAGSGMHAGDPKRGGKKRFAEMTGPEREAALLSELRGMSPTRPDAI